MSQEQPPISDVAVEVQVGDGEAAIEFPAEGLTTSCPVTPVGSGLYRLDGVPIGAESASYNDVIEAEALGRGKLRFRRVAQASGWRVYDYVLPRGWLDSGSGKQYLADLDARGARWERVFGGMLFVCVPPELAFDPTASIQAAVRPAT
ncbi:MAG TPA: DUF4265 domain-containing protein [Tepidisphaeraceae bacterium]|nr:DUF4265 domain-containing protein [Tepidisphaeraceae bacterium]